MKTEMRKLLFIFGTRPEAIKLAPLYMIFKHSKNYEIEVCISSQHKEMLLPVLNIFNIYVNYDLDVMSHNQSLSNISSLILDRATKVINQSNPDLIFVHGDTTTTLMSSIAAFYSRKKIAHVEAGLRTHLLTAPFPEEFNRQLVSRYADLHFCPTKLSARNLTSEGIHKEKIFLTGNTVIDSLNYVVSKLSSDSKLRQRTIMSIKHKISADLNKTFVLITGHRRENFGAGFENICSAIHSLANKYPNVNFIYPVHLNPNIKEKAFRFLGGIKNIFLTDPLDYLEFIYMQSKAHFIITDSGGIQEEAPSLGKPVLVMRDTTERPEAVKSGTVKLVGSKKKKIIFWTSRLLDDKDFYKKMSKSINPYGDGKSSKRILNIVDKFYGIK